MAAVERHDGPRPTAHLLHRARHHPSSSGPQPTQMGDSPGSLVCEHRRMTTDFLTSFSNQLADAVAAAAPPVVQVQGRRQPIRGLVYADNGVWTTVRALGRGDALHVRRHDGRTFEAELAGWDP